MNLDSIEVCPVPGSLDSVLCSVMTAERKSISSSSSGYVLILPGGTQNHSLNTSTTQGVNRFPKATINQFLSVQEPNNQIFIQCGYTRPI